MLREIGVETGGSNVQFAMNPADGRMVVIEMNPRVSRSSALASKATGFPIAKVAARWPSATRSTSSTTTSPGRRRPAFEPTIDYVVTKIPRFAFEKYPGAEPYLTTSMKSVGEVMAIGRTFPRAMQKALRGLETGLTGFDDDEIDPVGRGRSGHRPAPPSCVALGVPTPDRIRVIAQAFRHGLTVEEINGGLRYEPWFLRQIADIVREEGHVRVRAGCLADRRGRHAQAEGARLLRTPV